jgi:hypothetical protein
MRRKTRGLLSWAVTGVLTLGLGTGVVLMTAAPTALTAASTTAKTTTVAAAVPTPVATTTATSPSTPIVLHMIPSPGYVDDSYPSSSRTVSYDN